MKFKYYFLISIFLFLSTPVSADVMNFNVTEPAYIYIESNTASSEPYWIEPEVIENKSFWEEITEKYWLFFIKFVN